jgi:hypothetical protein
MNFSHEYLKNKNYSMSKKLILFVFVLVGSLNSVQACSCDWFSFCETMIALDDDLIVSGELTYVDTTKARLKIIDTFKGTETNDTITIWAGDGWECNGWMSMATHHLGHVGDTIIIILPRLSEGNYSRPDWFCYSSVLNVNNQVVHYGGGFEYSDFVNLWDNESVDCSSLNGIGENNLIPLKLFPNPATEKISIELPPNSGTLSSVVISDVAGNVALRATEAREIDVSILSPGIYFVLAETDKFVFRQKLVKQ